MRVWLHIDSPIGQRTPCCGIGPPLRREYITIKPTIRKALALRKRRQTLRRKAKSR